MCICGRFIKKDGVFVDSLRRIGIELESGLALNVLTTTTECLIEMYWLGFLHRCSDLLPVEGVIIWLYILSWHLGQVSLCVVPDRLILFEVCLVAEVHFLLGDKALLLLLHSLLNLSDGRLVSNSVEFLTLG